MRCKGIRVEVNVAGHGRNGVLRKLHIKAHQTDSGPARISAANVVQIELFTER